jgi:Fe-S-cluster-containing dehydrogenase component
VLFTLAALHAPAPQVQHIMARWARQAVVRQIPQAGAPHAGRFPAGLEALLLQRVSTRTAAWFRCAHCASPCVSACPVLLPWREQVIEGQQ